MQPLSRTAPDLLHALASFGTATVHEAAGQIGALPGAIASIRPGVALVGQAFPVLCPPGDNLALHRAIATAQSGDVLVVDCSADIEHGPFGEIMAVACQSRGITGLVINGAVRDSQRLIEMGFPVFALARCIQGTRKRDPGRVGDPVTIGKTVITRGDIIIGDDDGVVAIPAYQAMDVAKKSRQRLVAERLMIHRIQSGQTTLDVLGLEP